MTKKTTSVSGNVNAAIQGFPGSFHEMAARKFFLETEITILPCFTFKEAFDLVNDLSADVACVAIENSLGGSLLPNYSLLRNSGLKIGGEIFLRIEQHLMALPGQKTEDIIEIQSHPMAIVQCEDFLEPYRKKGVRIVDTPDTALSARNIAVEKLKGVAALASDLAAQMYGLEILMHGVETNKRNFTRFLMLAKEEKMDQVLMPQDQQTINKASLCFSLPHKIGSLSQILSVLAFYRVNMTKIQSAPIIGKEWEYFFYIDLLFDDEDMFKSSLNAIGPLTDQLQVMGVYASGNQ
jgi:prephenate dehydratase